MMDVDDQDPRTLALSALELLTKIAACTLLTPLVILGYWRARYEEARWSRADIGTAGLHLLACLVWTVAVRLLTLQGPP